MMVLAAENLSMLRQFTHAYFAGVMFPISTFRAAIVNLRVLD
jgi:hypothetical protein